MFLSNRTLRPFYSLVIFIPCSLAAVNRKRDYLCDHPRPPLTYILLKPLTKTIDKGATTFATTRDHLYDSLFDLIFKVLFNLKLNKKG